MPWAILDNLFAFPVFLWIILVSAIGGIIIADYLFAEMPGA